MPRVHRALAIFFLALVGTTSGACLDATEIRIQVTTDVDCARVSGVLIAIGPLDRVETQPGAATSITCTNGTVGALVVVPSGDRRAEVGIRVVMGLDGESPERCVADGYVGGCVVARRALRFLTHNELDVPIRMEAACINVACDAKSSCAKSTCVPTSACQGGPCTTSPPRTWSPLPANLAVGRTDPFFAWSGRALSLWSGDTTTGFATDGLSYDPVARAWTPIAPPKFALDGRLPGAGVWTGHAFVVWGGMNFGNGYADGARYDGQAWTTTADPTKFPGLAAFAGRSGFASVWADSVKKLIVWGGGSANNAYFNDGAAYDPALDVWAPIAPSPLTARGVSTAVWVGGRMLIYGGFCPSGPCDDVAAYEPTTNTWLPAHHLLDPGTRVPHVAVTDGKRAFFWGGRACPTCPSDSRLVIIDPATLDAEVRSGSDDPAPRRGAAGWWADGKLWFWGGTSNADVALGDGASYDPTTFQWTPLPTQGAPSPRANHVVVWTGREAIVYGGAGAGGTPLSDGATFGP